MKERNRKTHTNRQTEDRLRGRVINETNGHICRQKDKTETGKGEGTTSGGGGCWMLHIHKT